MFYASFEKFSDMTGAFNGTTSSMSDTDPYPDTADTDRTGLDTDLDNLEDTDPFEQDDEATETFEDLDEDDTEVGEGPADGGINEVDLDFGPEDIEPDWNPMDDVSPADEATGTSHEDEAADTQLDDAPHDQWDEVMPDQEISQEDDVSEVDDISQWEEVQFDEPLWFEDEDDSDQDLTNDAVEDILDIDHLNDITDDTFDEIEQQGQGMLTAADWVAGLEDFLDFTEQDVSTFNDDPQQGYETTDGYDPPYPDNTADGMIELPNLVDDVFIDIFPDPINEAFAWFDSLGGVYRCIPFWPSPSPSLNVKRLSGCQCLLCLWS